MRTHHADPWLIVAFTVGALALLVGFPALFALIDQSASSIFAGVVR